ncbi:unnamed protein product [Agarophyton chilense]
MTTKSHIPKKRKTPKKHKSKGQQLLISRFFSPAVPKQSPESDPVRKQAENTPVKDNEFIAEKDLAIAPMTEELLTPQEETSPVEVLEPKPNGENSPFKEQTPQKKPKGIFFSENDTGVSEKHDEASGAPEPDTPTTAVLFSPSQNEETASPSPLRRTPRKRNRRRFIVVDDEEIESDEEPQQKRTRSDDPDFQAEHDDGQSENDEGDIDLVASQDLLKEGQSKDYSEPEEETSRTLTRKPRQALSSFEFSREAELNKIVSDPKRRKQFTQKIGRLEKNSFFLRRTGGGGAPVEEKHETRKATKYTPLESQIIKLRELYSDMVLVVECGYKYRLFDKDASIASKVLRIASFFDHNFLTSSFPTHRLAFHVRRLAEAGFKVGVVSQSETAALKRANCKSGLFERRLSAVYTKGTIAADGTLGSAAVGGNGGVKSASYIMTILETQSLKEKDFMKRISLAAVDSASGEVFYDSFTDDALRSDLESRLVAIEPVEILMPKGRCSRATELVVKGFCESMSSRLERMNDGVFELGAAKKAMKSKMRDGSDSILDPHVISCLGALVEYLKQFKLELSVTSAVEYKEFQTKRHMKIGADVLKNFEVFGNSNNGSVQGSLVGLVNRTRTAFGSRLMRQWISHPLVNGTEIINRLNAVEYISRLISDQSEIDNQTDSFGGALSVLIRNLHKVPDLDQGLTRVACHKSTPSELNSILLAVYEAGETFEKLRLTSEQPNLPHLLVKLVKTAPSIRGIMDNPIVRILNQEAASKDQYYTLFYQDEHLADILGNSETKDEFITIAMELLSASENLKVAERHMDKILRRLREQHSKPKWEWKKVAHEEYLLEVPTTRVSTLPRSWTIVSQTKAVKRFRPPEAMSGYEKVLCCRERRDAVSAQCWQSYLRLFAEIALPLRALVRILADVDCLSSLAQVANMPGYSKPEIESDPCKPAGVIAENARHPLTELLPSCQSYVPNDIRLASAEHEIALVISGPNYGGKSSYARMTALIVILAQIGSFVPATAATICPYDSIFARMGSSDSISKGMSSLMVELAETSRILSHASSRSLVVLDELGRGTSTHDGTAVAYATLSHLIADIGCTTIFVTHYPILASLRSEYPRLVRASYMNYIEAQEKGANGFPEGDRLSLSHEPGEKQTKKSRIVFLYKLTDGVAPSSYGLNVARLAGIPEEIVDEAHSKASELETALESQKEDGKMAYLLGTKLWGEPNVVQHLLQLVRDGHDSC